MFSSILSSRTCGSLLAFVMCSGLALTAESPKPVAEVGKAVVQSPQVGAQAPDFTLAALGGEPVTLSVLLAKGPVVLVVLRGWPGYQCPACDRQAQDFIASASAFAEAKAAVVMVYPGPADDLKAHAQQFREMKGKQWPATYQYLLDPDYTMVKAYGLRWDTAKETAYPATYVFDQQGHVRFVKISKGHGDRAKAADIVAEINKIPGK